jgi:branched-chain amino acid transport system ATP-binding protein
MSADPSAPATSAGLVEGAVDGVADDPIEHDGPALIQVRGVTKHFQGVAALTDVNLDIYAGEVLGLVGPNGAGKTTLVNAITGYIPPDSGSVVLDGRDITGTRMDRAARLGITRTFQHLRLLERSSVLENVLLGRHQRFTVTPLKMFGTRRREEREQRVASRLLLDELGLGHLADTMAASLPYGVRRRVEIARALAAEPRALLLDEPTAGMTPADAGDIGEMIVQTARSGVAVMLIEHNVGLVTQLSDRIAVLDWGQIIKVDRPDEVWKDERVRAAYIGGVAT